MKQDMDEQLSVISGTTSGSEFNSENDYLQSLLPLLGVERALSPQIESQDLSISGYRHPYGLSKTSPCLYSPEHSTRRHIVEKKDNPSVKMAQSLKYLSPPEMNSQGNQEYFNLSCSRKNEFISQNEYNFYRMSSKMNTTNASDMEIASEETAQRFLAVDLIEKTEGHFNCGSFISQKDAEKIKPETEQNKKIHCPEVLKNIDQCDCMGIVPQTSSVSNSRPDSGSTCLEIEAESNLSPASKELNGILTRSESNTDRQTMGTSDLEISYSNQQRITISYSDICSPNEHTMVVSRPRFDFQNQYNLVVQDRGEHLPDQLVMSSPGTNFQDQHMSTPGTNFPDHIMSPSRTNIPDQQMSTPGTNFPDHIMSPSRTNISDQQMSTPGTNFLDQHIMCTPGTNFPDQHIMSTPGTNFPDQHIMSPSGTNNSDQQMSTPGTNFPGHHMSTPGTNFPDHMSTPGTNFPDHHIMCTPGTNFPDQHIMSTPGTNFPDQHIMTTPGTNFPDQQMSTPGTNFPDQHIMSTPGTNFPDQHIMSTPGTNFPDQHIMSTPGTNFPDQHIMSTSETNFPDQHIMSTPGTNFQDQQIMSTSGTNFPDQDRMSTPGTNFPNQHIVSTPGTNFPDQQMSIPGTNFPDQHIMSTPGTNFPDHQMSTPGNNFPDQHIMSTPGTNFPDQHILSTSGTNFPDQHIMSTPGANFPDQEMSTSGTNFPDQEMSTPGTNFQDQHMSTPGANFPDQEMSTSGTNFPDQEMSMSGTNFPDQHIMSTSEINFPEQQIVSTPRTNISDQHITSPSVINFPYHQIMSTSGTNFPDQQIASTTGASFLNQPIMLTTGTNFSDHSKLAVSNQIPVCPLQQKMKMYHPKIIVSEQQELAISDSTNFLSNVPVEKSSYLKLKCSPTSSNKETDAGASNEAVDCDSSSIVSCSTVAPSGPLERIILTDQVMPHKITTSHSLPKKEKEINSKKINEATETKPSGSLSTSSQESDASSKMLICSSVAGFHQDNWKMKYSSNSKQTDKIVCRNGSPLTSTTKELSQRFTHCKGDLGDVSLLKEFAASSHLPTIEPSQAATSGAKFNTTTDKNDTPQTGPNKEAKSKVEQNPSLIVLPPNFELLKTGNDETQRPGLECCDVDDATTHRCFLGTQEQKMPGTTPSADDGLNGKAGNLQHIWRTRQRQQNAECCRTSGDRINMSAVVSMTEFSQDGFSNSKMKLEGSSKNKTPSKDTHSLNRLLDLYDKILEKLNSGCVLDGRSHLDKFEQIINKLRIQLDKDKTSFLSSSSREQGKRRKLKEINDSQTMLTRALEKHELLKQRVLTLQTSTESQKLNRATINPLKNNNNGDNTYFQQKNISPIGNTCPSIGRSEITAQNIHQDKNQAKHTVPWLGQNLLGAGSDKPCLNSLPLFQNPASKTQEDSEQMPLAESGTKKVTKRRQTECTNSCSEKVKITDGNSPSDKNASTSCSQTQSYSYLPSPKIVNDTSSINTATKDIYLTSPGVMSTENDLNHQQHLTSISLMETGDNGAELNASKNKSEAMTAGSSSFPKSLFSRKLEPQGLFKESENSRGIVAGKARPFIGSDQAASNYDASRECQSHVQACESLAYAGGGQIDYIDTAMPNNQTDTSMPNIQTDSVAKDYQTQSKSTPVSALADAVVINGSIVLSSNFNVKHLDFRVNSDGQRSQNVIPKVLLCSQNLKPEFAAFHSENAVKDRVVGENVQSQNDKSHVILYERGKKQAQTNITTIDSSKCKMGPINKPKQSLGRHPASPSSTISSSLFAVPSKEIVRRMESRIASDISQTPQQVKNNPQSIMDSRITLDISQTTQQVKNNPQSTLTQTNISKTYQTPGMQTTGINNLAIQTSAAKNLVLAGQSKTDQSTCADIFPNSSTNTIFVQTNVIPSGNHTKIVLPGPKKRRQPKKVICTDIGFKKTKYSQNVPEKGKLEHHNSLTNTSLIQRNESMSQFTSGNMPKNNCTKAVFDSTLQKSKNICLKSNLDKFKPPESSCTKDNLNNIQQTPKNHCTTMATNLENIPEMSTNKCRAANLDVNQQMPIKNISTTANLDSFQQISKLPKISLTTSGSIDGSLLIRNLRSVLMIADEEVADADKDFPPDFWNEDFSNIKISESFWNTLDVW